MAASDNSTAEIVDAGSRLYDANIRAGVEAQNRGRFLALDIDSGEYEIADTLLEASRRLRKRRPAASVYGVRIGHDAVFRVGELRCEPLIGMRLLHRQRLTIDILDGGPVTIGRLDHT